LQDGAATRRIANLAVQQIETALTTLRKDVGMGSAADYFAKQLPDARALAQKLAKR
jgi:hypothetical protein